MEDGGSSRITIFNQMQSPDTLVYHPEVIGKHSI